MIYLFTTSEAVANKATALLDSMCGYPNPDTKTDRAVAVLKHPTKDWWIMPIPDGVYGPKVKSYLDAKGLLPADRKDDLVINTVAEAQAKLTQLKNANADDAHFFCLITQNVAEAGGFFS